ncbi:MAG: cytochrome c3 family protein [Planctomycetota bacterium]
MTIAVRRLILATVLGVAAAAGAGERKAPETLDPKASCTTKDCHGDLRQAKKVHGPIAADECKSCHTWKSNKHDFTITREGPALCTACHDDMAYAASKEKAREAKVSVHEPVGEDCLSCHMPHGGETRDFVVAAPLELCAVCHDETLEKAKAKTNRSAHAAMFEGKGCMGCHAVHASQFDYLLAAKPMDACLSCHDKAIETDGRTIASVKAAIGGKGKVVHGPIRDDNDCLSCHRGHASPHAALLTLAYPAGKYAPFSPDAYELCFACHDAELAAAAETEDATGFRNGQRNLHAVHVARERKGRSCGLCHDAHGSERAHLLEKDVPFGTAGWKLPIGFKPTEHGGTCTSGCHLPKAYDREKPVQN